MILGRRSPSSRAFVQARPVPQRLDPTPSGLVLPNAPLARGRRRAGSRRMTSGADPASSWARVTTRAGAATVWARGAGGAGSAPPGRTKLSSGARGPRRSSSWKASRASTWWALDAWGWRASPWGAAGRCAQVEHAPRQATVTSITHGDPRFSPSSGERVRAPATRRIGRLCRPDPEPTRR